MGDARAVDPLITVVEYCDTKIRKAAISALKNIGNARAIGPLIAILRDRDLETRKCAAYALRHLYNFVRLDQQAKNLILDMQEVMAQSHTDFSSSDCGPSSHTDIGIGVTL